MGVLLVGVIVVAYSVIIGVGDSDTAIQSKVLTSTENNQIAENQAEMKQLKSLIEEALVWRVMARSSYEEIKPFLNGNTSIPQEVQNAIVKESLGYLKLRKKIMSLAVKYKKYLTGYRLKLSLNKKSGIVSESVKELDHGNYNGKGRNRKHKDTLVINPLDEKGQQYIRSLKISLSAALVLYDNFLVGVFPYADNKIVRKKINQDNLELKGALGDIEDSYYAWGPRLLVEDAIGLFEEEQKFLKTKLGQTLVMSEDARYLNTLISSSLSYEELRDISIIKVWWSRFVKRHDQRMDVYRGVKIESTNAISKLFGNSMGIFESRKGFLYSNEELSANIQAQLKPLDILLEKTPFRLTDSFIPGHWGHVAIWVGSEEELKAIKKNGVSAWDALGANFGNKGPEMQESIATNHRIVEALRPGVMINTLNHFLNIDDLGVMRRSASNNLTDAQKFDYLMLAFKQVGKEYDFNFDVNTDDKIVCSELIYKVYPHDAWPTTESINRWTISPDNVVELAVEREGEGYQYDIPLLYSAGLEISGDSEHKREKMKRLLLYSYEDQVAILTKKTKPIKTAVINEHK